MVMVGMPVEVLASIPENGVKQRFAATSFDDKSNAICGAHGFGSVCGWKVSGHAMNTPKRSI